MSPPPARSPGRKPLTVRRFLDLYLPLALTFLLMSGSSPVINMGIGGTPDETVGLAVFANAFVICLFLYSPCFVVRDSAQKFVFCRTSYRRVTVFHLLVAGACTVPLLVLSLTPLLDVVALRWLMRLPPDLVQPVKTAVLAFLPMPFLITLRGIHQAIHINNDSARWIGIGTAGRFGVIILFVFLVGVPAGLPGGVMGGMAIALGIATEMAVNMVTTRSRATFLREENSRPPPPDYAALRAFCGPLFLANAMGVFLQPLTISIVNDAIVAENSAAAFGVLKSFTWFFCSTLFAMQSMVLAKADSLANLRRLAFYELIPVSLFTGLILVVAWVPPVRDALLRDLFRIDDDRTVAFVVEAMPVALLLPALMGLRATARGLLMRSGRTSFVTWASLVALLLLLGLAVNRPAATAINGATMGYLGWIGAFAVEFVVLAWGVRRVGLAACVSESGRYDLPEPAREPVR